MSTLIPKKNYLSVKEVADLLGIAEKTIRKYVWLKTIPYTKIGGHIRFDQTRLDNWLEQRHVPTLNEIRNGSYRKSSTPRGGTKHA